VLLGLSAVKNIAIAASISRMFKGGQVTEQFSAKDLWRHSVAVGVAARKITKAAGDVAGLDEMFLAGLIHDLGLLMERQAFPEQLTDVVRRCAAGEGEFIALEQQIIGATHQEFGDALTTKWKFPRHLRAAVGFHHNPEGLSHELQRFGTIVHCADILCCQEKYGFYLTAQHEEFTEELLNSIGVSLEQLVEIRDSMEEELEEAQAMLGTG
jgi:HD-like signal output (HDOD) protein